MIPVARGKTLFIERIVVRGDGLQILDRLPPNFNGRLVGTLVAEGKTYDVVVLVEDGSLVAVSVDSKPAKPEDLRKLLEEADDGFLEVQELDRAGIDLDKDYNSDFLLDSPVPLRDIVASTTESRVEEEERREEEQPLAVRVETTVEKEEGEVRPPETVVEEEGEKAETPVMVEEAVSQVAVVEEAGKREEEAVAETPREGNGVGVAEAVEEEVAPATSSVEEVYEAEQTEVIGRIEEGVIDASRTIPVTGAGSLQVVLEKLRSYADPHVVDTCSSLLRDKIIEAYLVFVRNETMLRKISPEGLAEELTKIIESTKESDSFIRVVIYVGNDKPSHDLVLLMYRGRVVATLLWNNANPLDVVATGSTVLEEPPREIVGKRVLGTIAYLVPRDPLENVLGCEKVLREAEERRARREEKPKPRPQKEQKKGILSRIFGR